VGTLVALIAVLAALAFIMRRISPRSNQPPLLPQVPEAAISEIVAHMARAGYIVTNSGPASATFSRHKRPDWQVIVLILVVAVISIGPLEQAFLLLLLWWFVLAVVLVCYLLYFPIVRPTNTTGVTALGTVFGTDIVVSGNDRKARAEVDRWRRTAHVSA
jgi:hypothetical protein